MSLNLKNLDRNTPMLLPPDLREWLPENHIIHFLIEAVNQLPESLFQYNYRGSGDAQYPPRMMLCLLIYCYATGRFSSRVIQQATYEDVGVRYICGGDLHPDHDTICAFRRNNGSLFDQAFLRVLLMAQESLGIKKFCTLSIDGTKIKADASKHSAVSYKHAGEQVAFLQEEIEKLRAKAEQADSTPLQEGFEIPEEIIRREKLQGSLKQAREAIEKRFAVEQEEKVAEYEEKKALFEEKEKKKQRRGSRPKPPSEEPPDKMQHNFTDPESRIMPTGSDGYDQCYNAQAAVDTEKMLVVTCEVTNQPNDRQQLVPVLASMPEEIEQPESVLIDSGYFSASAVEQVEADGGPTVYCGMGREAHHYAVEDLEKTGDAPSLPEGATGAQRMTHRMQTAKAKAYYKQRKQTVEPVFGIIKEVIGFRRFSMRGKEKAESEFTLVCLTYNLKRIFKLRQGCGQIPA